MAATKKLAKFTVTEAGEDFELHVEDEAGRVLELIATRDQVDLIADSLDEILSQDDSADEIDDDADDDGADEDEIEDDDLLDEDDDETPEDEASEDVADVKSRRA